MSPGAWKTICTEDPDVLVLHRHGTRRIREAQRYDLLHDDDVALRELFFSSTVDWKERGSAECARPRVFLKATALCSPSRRRPTSRGRCASASRPGRPADNTVAINGRRLEVAGTPGSYLAITRAWKAGDRVEFTMPMRLTAEPLADDPTSRHFSTVRSCSRANFPRRRSRKICSTTRVRRFRRRRK